MASAQHDFITQRLDGRLTQSRHAAPGERQREYTFEQIDHACPHERNSMKAPHIRPLLSLAAVATLAVAAPLAHADPAGLQRCRGISDATQRLACYDALPITAAPAAPAASGAGANTPSLAASAPVAAASKVDEFGLEDKRAAANQLPTVESSITGRFEGWGPNSRITLANGQVWRVSDDSSATLYLDNPKVVVRRGLLGAFYLEVDGTNRSPKVKRVK
jgi:hypothetical protein